MPSTFGIPSLDTERPKRWHRIVHCFGERKYMVAALRDFGYCKCRGFPTKAGIGTSANTFRSITPRRWRSSTGAACAQGARFKLQWRKLQIAFDHWHIGLLN